MPQRTTVAPGRDDAGSDDAGSDVEDLGVALLVGAARLTRWAGRAADAPVPQAPRRAPSQLQELGPLPVSALAALDRTSPPTATALVAREAPG